MSVNPDSPIQGPYVQFSVPAASTKQSKKTQTYKGQDGNVKQAGEELFKIKVYTQDEMKGTRKIKALLTGILPEKYGYLQFRCNVNGKKQMVGYVKYSDYVKELRALGIDIKKESYSDIRHRIDRLEKRYIPNQTPAIILPEDSPEFIEDTLTQEEQAFVNAAKYNRITSTYEPLNSLLECWYDGGPDTKEYTSKQIGLLICKDEQAQKNVETETLYKFFRSDLFQHFIKDQNELVSDKQIDLKPLLKFRTEISKTNQLEQKNIDIIKAYIKYKDKQNQVDSHFEGYTRRQFQLATEETTNAFNELKKLID